MMYPTASDFDDLFSEALISNQDQPIEWIRSWVMEACESGTDRLPLASATIGPYCSVGNVVNGDERGMDLWVKVRDHLVDTIKETMPGVVDDELYFDINHRGDYGIVSANYSSVAGHKVIAKIKWGTVPHQIC